MTNMKPALREKIVEYEDLAVRKLDQSLRLTNLVNILLDSLEIPDGAPETISPFEYSLYRFFAFTSINESGQFKMTQYITKNISMIEYWSRLTMLLLISQTE